jgi:hypothetical protein
MSLKLSFPRAGMKMLSVSALALKSSKVVVRELVEYVFSFLIGAVAYTISFILKEDHTGHPVTNKFDPLFFLYVRNI